MLLALCLTLLCVSCGKERTTEESTSRPQTPSQQANSSATIAQTEQPAFRSEAHLPQANPVTATAQVEQPITKLLAETQSHEYFVADPDERVNLVKRIGATKSPLAVPFLTQNLMKISPVHSPDGLVGSFPCSAALVEIGEPAVPQIQARLLAAGTNLEQMVLLDTLRRIKGSEYVASWLDSLPGEGIGSLPAQRRTELKQWALSHTP